MARTDCKRSIRASVRVMGLVDVSFKMKTKPVAVPKKKQKVAR